MLCSPRGIGLQTALYMLHYSGMRDGGMDDGGMKGWRDEGMEGWRDGGMEGWRDGGMEERHGDILVTD